MSVLSKTRNLFVGPQVRGMKRAEARRKRHAPELRWLHRGRRLIGKDKNGEPVYVQVYQSLANRVLSRRARHRFIVEWRSPFRPGWQARFRKPSFARLWKVAR